MIAGSQPAVLFHERRSSVVAPVPVHHIGTGGPHLASSGSRDLRAILIAYFDPDTWDGDAHGAEFAFELRWRQIGQSSSCFGLAVHHIDLHSWQRLAQPACQGR